MTVLSTAKKANKQCNGSNVNPGLNADDIAEQDDARPSQHAEVRQEEEETDAETGQNDLSLAWWPMVSWDCYLQQESEEEARPRAKGEEEE